MTVRNRAKRNERVEGSKSMSHVPNHAFPQTELRSAFKFGTPEKNCLLSTDQQSEAKQAELG